MKETNVIDSIGEVNDRGTPTSPIQFYVPNLTPESRQGVASPRPRGGDRIAAAISSLAALNILLLALLLAGPAAAQAPVNVNINLPDVDLGPVTWGDFDNDGNLDILMTGNTGLGYISQVWRNQGNGTFADINAGLPGLLKSAAAWGDYDNDGYLDFVIAGLDGTLNARTEVWHNQGNGTFVKSGIVLPGVSSCAVAWGDFDNDGNLDILLTGNDVNGKALTQIWRNNGDGSFAKMNVQITPVKNSSVALADFDNDGNLDIVLSGISSNNAPVTQIWRNLGNGSFAQVNAGLVGLANGSIAVGDYDNDGNVDIFVSGINASGQVIGTLWHNLGNLAFSAVNSGLPGVYSGKVAWGDYDNDGNLDLLVSGYNASRVPVCQVWLNMGNGVFANADLGLPGIGSGAVAWGDFNGDGKLDILLSGYTGAGFTSQIWRNQTAVANTAPSMPGALAFSPTATGAFLSWQASTDTETPATGLSYNLRVGTKPRGSDIVSPSSILATGERLLPQPGNVQGGLSVNLPLPPGIYYWSVQAVDTSFAGSTFAPEASFVLGAVVVTSPATQITSSSAFLGGTVNPRGASTTAWFEWGTSITYNNTNPIVTVGNGTSTLPISQAVLSLLPNTRYHYRLVAADAFGLSYGTDQTFVTAAGQSSATYAGTVSAAGGFLVGSTSGLTTNVDVLVPGGTTTQLQFKGGILIGVVPH